MCGGVEEINWSKVEAKFLKQDGLHEYYLLYVLLNQTPVKMKAVKNHCL